MMGIYKILSLAIFTFFLLSMSLVSMYSSMATVKLTKAVKKDSF